MKEELMELLESADLCDTVLTFNGYDITLYHDDFMPDTCLGWNDISGVFFHGSYDLVNCTDYTSNDFESWDELEQRLKKDGYKTIIPVTMTDHSGLWLRRAGSAYECPWDSGRIGYIVSKEKVRPDVVDKYIAMYEDELNGNFFGYSVERVSGVYVDGCGCYYGADIQSMFDDIWTAIESDMKEQQRARDKKLAGMIKANVPLEIRAKELDNIK